MDGDEAVEMVRLPGVEMVRLPVSEMVVWEDLVLG